MTFDVASMVSSGTTVANGTPSFERLSGNGQYLVWISDSTDQIGTGWTGYAVYRYDRSTHTVARLSLSTEAVDFAGPDISENGNTVTYAITRSGNPYIEVLDVTGGTRVEISPSAAAVPTRLRLSPDASTLAV